MNAFRLILVALFLVLAAPLSAQIALGTTSATSEDAATALPDPLTPEAANALISRLSDSEVRALLLEQLNTQSTGAEDSQVAVSDFLFHATTGALDSVLTPIKRLSDLFSGQARAFSNFLENVGTDGILQFLSLFALAFIGAIAAELAFRYFVRGWLNLPATEANAEASIWQTLSSLFKRLCLDVVAVMVFILVASQISRFIMPPELDVYANLIGPYLIAFPRLAWAVGRFFLAPQNPAYRIVRASDSFARKAVWHQAWLVLLIGVGVFIVEFNRLNGVPLGETRIGFWFNLAVHVYVAVFMWVYRADVSDMMRGKDELTRGEELAARFFPYFGVIVSVGTWWVINIIVSYREFELLGTMPHYKTMTLLLFAPVIDTAIRGLVRHLVPPMTGEGPIAERAYQSTKRSYIRIGRVIVFAASLIAIARFWGMTPQGIAGAGVGERFAAHFIEMLMILSIGYLIYEHVSLWINRKLAAEQTAAGVDPNEEEMGGGEGGGAGGSRLSTVLPLILATARVAIVVVFLLLALGNVGVDTTPLLAGAGIVGLAVGFGAQKLVTDVVSGVFFLIDDAFRTGEYVEVDGTMGTVEKISIRSMQLRHHKGPVHTIPYGEIPKLTNYSRDWVIMKLRFTVPFDTDPNKVKKIFKKIGQEMLQVPEFADDFLQPFKSQGVFEIDDMGMVIRGKFMAKPGKQFTLRKEIFNRVKAAFTENGIDFARREVRVAIPNLESKDELTEEDKASIAAAASQAAQEMTEQAQDAPKPGD